MRVAVAGGTGLLGRQVVAALRAGGHDAVVVARATGVDLTTGAGLVAALDRVDAVVDCTDPATVSGRRATAFFEVAGAQLQRAGMAAEVAQLLAELAVGPSSGGTTRPDELRRPRPCGGRRPVAPASSGRCTAGDRRDDAAVESFR